MQLVRAGPKHERSTGRGSGGSGGGGGQNTPPPPQRLLSPRPGLDPVRGDTVYPLRLATGQHRGAALSDPAAGVLLCLVGADGASLLHRVPRLYDPAATQLEMQEMCALLDVDSEAAGANCALALSAAAAAQLPDGGDGGGGMRLRFQVRGWMGEGEPSTCAELELLAAVANIPPYPMPMCALPPPPPHCTADTAGGLGGRSVVCLPRARPAGGAAGGARGGALAV